MNKRIGEAFDRIHAEEELKNKTIEFLARQTGGFGQHSGQFPGKERLCHMEKWLQRQPFLP